MKPSRKILLKKIYDHEQVNNSPFQTPTDGSEVSSDAATLKSDVLYLKRHDYVESPLALIGCYCLSLTDKGEAFVENGFQSPQEFQQTTTFHFDGATITNSVVGQNVSDNQLSFSFNNCLSELQTISEGKPAETNAEIKELLAELKSLKESQKPIPKGFFSRFSDLIKKHTDLIVPVGKALVSICFGIE